MKALNVYVGLEVGGRSTVWGWRASSARSYRWLPFSVSSIQEAVLKVYEEGPPPELRRYVLETFSWERAAERLIGIYKELV
ncbi:MAG: hypothetical protein KGZ53_04370 [Peptococcaceae bacterium]|nr:hypothetical protein [Peptococcaceae bacterium]